MLMIIMLAGYWIITGKPQIIEFSRASLFPDISQMTHLVFLLGLLFGLVGIEMSAVHAGDVKNPQRDYPRALVYSTIIILLSLMFSSLAIAIVIPQQKLSLVSGLLDAFNIFFTTFHMQWMMPIMIFLIIFGALSSTSAWIIGPTKGLLIAIQDSNILKPLQKINRYGIPSNILITQALIFTCLCSVFILLPNINSSYWILSAISAQFALIVYVLMFSAGIYLRYKYPNKIRPYSIPFGNVGMWVVSLIGITTCLVSCIIGFFPPSQIEVGNTFLYEAILIIGTLIFTVPPLLFRIKNHD